MRELDRRREERLEFRAAPARGDDRSAEIAVQHAAEIDAVLHQHRPVEAELVAQALVALRVDAALAGQRLDRIAGDQTDEEEGEQA